MSPIDCGSDLSPTAALERRVPVGLKPDPLRVVEDFCGVVLATSRSGRISIRGG
jgi:hypothetical protein